MDPLYEFKYGSQKVKLYDNRLEQTYPGLIPFTKKTNIIYYKDIRDISAHKKSLRIHLGAASVRQINGSKKDIEQALAIINAHIS